MALTSKITHEWEVSDEDGPLIHIEATKTTAKITLARDHAGAVYLNDAELRELARAANAAARV